MFKKQASFKPASTIRNSERKALAADIQTRFPQVFISKTPEESKELLEVILPLSGIEAAPFTTTKGLRGVLYSHGNLAILIKYEDKLVPTLSTLWKCPSLVTTVLTGSQVLANLQAGSDLMVKGMFEYTESVRTGDVVGIHITDRPHVVAIGIAAVNFSGLQRERGGKGLLLVTCIGDTITPESSRPARPTSGTSVECELVPLEEEVTSVKDTKEHVRSDDSAGMESPGMPALRTEDIDDAFVQALLYGLYIFHSEGRESSFTLPMAGSTLIDSHVLPHLPSKHPDLVLKKTSWKKAAKFISKQKFIKSKEVKGQVSITGIDWSSEDLRTFVPFRLPEVQREDASPHHASLSGRVKDEGDQTTTTTTTTTITAEESYRLPASFDSLLVPGRTEHREHYRPSDLAALVDTYCSHNALAVPGNKKLVTFDANLYHLLGNKTSQKQVSREVLVRGLVKAGVVHHCINGGKMRKGPVPEVRIVMESRNAKRSVTRVAHLEKYLGTDQVEDLCGALRHKCAVSVSVGEVKGTKPGSSVEITVQGKKAPEVQTVLQTWGLRKEWLKVEDKTK